jgi:hypothetical protein
MMDRVTIVFLVGSTAFGALLFTELRDTADQPTVLPVATRTELAAAPAVQRPRVDELVQTALAQPLFSPSRRPPDRPTGDATGPGLGNLRLTGIVIEPERHLAIFAVPGDKPLVRAEGETINQLRLESIEPNQVSLSGPRGGLTLEPKSDASLVRRKQSAQPTAANAQAGAGGARSPASRAAGPQPAAATNRPTPPNAPAAAGPGRRPNPTRPQ